MTLGKDVNLSPWYLNTRRLALLANVNIASAAQMSLNQNSGERASEMQRAARIADAILKSGKIPNLTRELIVKGKPGERVVASIWGVFTFRGISAALMAEEAGKKVVPATLSGRIPFGDDEYTFDGVLSNDHVYSTTSTTLMSGKRRALVVGQFEFSGQKVEVFPYIIGDFTGDLSSLGSLLHGWPMRSRIYPALIDPFADIQNVNSVTKADLTKLRDISEERVKNAFAEIIGEPFVPKDWGGEKSDLYTSRLTISGRPLSTAFIFKGPAVRGPMHPANLGKRGDQLVRAFDEPATLIVIQHCDQIANSVIRQAEALSVDPSNPRLYCIIDGADTVRILKAFGKVGFRRPH